MRSFAAMFAGGMVLACAACAAPPSPPVSPEVAACQEGVYKDPVVKDLIEKGAGSPSFMREHEGDLRAAKAQSTLHCLQSRGLARPGGGVERRKDNF